MYVEEVYFLFRSKTVTQTFYVDQVCCSLESGSLSASLDFCWISVIFMECNSSNENSLYCLNELFKYHSKKFTTEYSMIYDHVEHNSLYLNVWFIVLISRMWQTRDPRATCHCWNDRYTWFLAMANLDAVQLSWWMWRLDCWSSSCSDRSPLCCRKDQIPVPIHHPVIKSINRSIDHTLF